MTHSEKKDTSPLDTTDISSEPSGMKEKTKIFSLVTFLNDWKWGILIPVLFVIAFGLAWLWELRLEPELGMRVTGETTDPSDGLPPVVEKISPVMDHVPATINPLQIDPEKNAGVLAASRKQVEAGVLTSLKQMEIRLQTLERQAYRWRIEAENRQKLWQGFVLLRQDIREGRAFENSCLLFTQFANAVFPSRVKWQENVAILTSFSKKGVWSLGKLVATLPTISLQATQKPEGFWEKIKSFFQTLFVIKRTTELSTAQEKQLQQLSVFLAAGNLDAGLQLLEKLPVLLTPELKKWLHQARAYQATEQLLQQLEHTLFTLPLSETP